MIWTEIASRLILASLFGAAIGFARERNDWVAGLHTRIPVCVEAALTMMISAYGSRDILGKVGIVLDLGWR